MKPKKRLGRPLIECGPSITCGKDGKAKMEKQSQKSQAGVELRAGGGTSVPEKSRWSASSSRKSSQVKKNHQWKTTSTQHQKPLWVLLEKATEELGVFAL